MRQLPTSTLLVCLAAGLAIGALSGLLSHLIGGVLGLVVALAIAIATTLLTGHLILAYRLPRLLHRHLSARVDPASAGPPPMAQAADIELVTEWQDALNKRDWAALAQLAHPELNVVTRGAKRPFSRKQYFKTLRSMAYAYPDLRTEAESTVRDPGKPDVVWVRFEAAGRARSGRDLDFTFWECWGLDPAHEMILAIADGGVVRVA